MGPHGYPTVSIFSPDLYALDVADYILGEGRASRLVARLRDEQGLVDSISSGSYTPAYDAGHFAISAVTAPANLEAAEQAIIAELTRLQEEPVTTAELERAKRQKAAELLLSRQTPQGRADNYGDDLCVTGDVNFGDRYVELAPPGCAGSDRRAMTTAIYQPKGMALRVRGVGL